jgi:hypothetical protein
MQLCFCIASVHKQYLNSTLVDRYFLDKFNQTSVFLNHTFILSTLKECKYCQHASKSRLQRAYERWALHRNMLAIFNWNLQCRKCSQSFKILSFNM